MHTLQPLKVALDFLIAITKPDASEYSIAVIKDAPKWLKLLAGNNYCVYGKTIYVPLDHLDLVASANELDKSIATGKLLPLLMILHDYKVVNLKTLWKFLHNSDFQIHYFMYEFFFFKAYQHPLFETISLGFMSTRKGLTLEEVQDKMQELLISHRPQTQG